jgi:hypothetical protein
MEILVILLFLLALVTLVGHGIWIGLARLFRGGEPKRAGGEFGERRPPAPGTLPRTHCPRCDARLVGGGCAICRWPLADYDRNPRPGAIRELRRQLTRFVDLGLIDQATSTRLDDLLEAELTHLSTETRPYVAAGDVAATIAEPELETPSAAEQKQEEIAIPPVEAPVSPAMLPPEERVREFVTRQQIWGAEPVPPATPKPPRRPWTDLLSAFMEEKNIRWGELVGGLMIVGCSIALVISFWAKIAERPFLKFFVFNGVTAALFGLGLYSERRWKLRTTSTGLLITASLLVPLNFLSIAAFTQGANAGGALTVLGELVSIGLFATLLYGAGKIVAPANIWALMAGTLGPSVLMLLTRRFVEPQSAALAAEWFGWAIVGAHAASNAVAHRARQGRGAESIAVNIPQVFKLLGITTFASFLAFAFLIYHMGDLAAAFQRLSPLLCAAGLTPLAVGLNVWRSPEATLAGGTYRTAGLSIAIAGSLLLVAGVVLSWPQPLRLLTTSGIAGATLVAVALLMRLPQAYLGALPCSVLAYLVIWHRLRGHFAWRDADAGQMLQALASGESGQSLLPLALVLAGIAWAFARRGRAEDGRFLAFSAAGVAALSIAALGWYGGGVPGDPLHVALFYAAYALAGYAVAERLKSRVVLCGCAALLLAAVLQGVVFYLATRWAVALPWATALLVNAGLMAAATAALSQSRALVRRDKFAPLLLAITHSASLAALSLLVIGIIRYAVPAAVVYPRLFTLALVWLMIARLKQSRSWFIAFQVCLAGTIWFAVASRLEWRAWFRESPYPWLDPWTVTAEGIALTVFCLGWVVAGGIGSLFRKRDARQPSRTSADATLRFGGIGMRQLSIESALLRLLLVAAAAVTIYAALPGVAQELSPRLTAPRAAVANRIVPPIEQFELLGIPHDHARGAFVWLWLLLLAVTLVAEMVVRNASANLLALMLVASLACPLLASGWQTEVAAASALRWLAAGFLFLASAAIWSRGQLAALAGRCGWQRAGKWPDPSHPVAPAIRAALTLSLAPLVAMGVHVGSQAVSRCPPNASTQGWFWPLGVFFAVSATVSLTLRNVFPDASPSRKRRVSSSTVTARASSLLLLLGMAPLVSVTLFAVATALKQSPILGPNPDSWFARAGLSTSYAVPVLATALTLVGYALRERSAPFAIAGGLVLNLGVTAAYLLAVAKTGLQFDAPLWIRLAQVNAITSASFALAWILVPIVRQLRAAVEFAYRPSELLVTQVCLPVALNLLVLIPTWGTIFLNPSPASELAVVGDRWGWTAAFLAIAAVVAIRLGSHPLVTSREFTVAAMAVGVLTAALVGSYAGTAWSALHTLLIFHVAIVSTLPAGIWWCDRAEQALDNRRRLSRSATCASIPAVLLALRSLVFDPQAPWWAVATLTVIAGVVSWFACAALRRGLLHYAAVLMVAAALGWWSHEGAALVGGSSRFLLGHLQVLVISLALPAVLWALFERFVFASAGDLATRIRPPAQRLAVRIALIVLALLVGLALFADVMNESNAMSLTMQWVALVAVGVGATALLWDAGAGDSVALLYGAGLLAAGTFLDSLDLSSHWMLWLGTITLSAYVLATSYLWSCRAGLRGWGDLLCVPRGSATPFAHQGWLVSVNSLLIAVVIVLTFAVELTYAEAALRTMASKSVLAAAIALGLLARGQRRTQLQFAALAVGAIWAIALAWSPLDPGSGLLHRSVAVATALGVMVVIYGLSFNKLLPTGSEWLSAAQRIVPKLVVAAGATLVLVLVIEVGMFVLHGEVRMAWQAIALVAVTLIGLTAAALAAALLPGRDPLNLSERGRQAYVYAAEILLALCFVHIRLTMPWLFGSVFAHYWPVIVMLIAFLGAGVGEWFRRRRLMVLGDPLENTGALLPLLPVIAFWILPTTRVDYSLLLLAVGLLYAGLSVARKSFGFGVLAAVSANGGLWYFLNRLEGFRLLEHPQLWLIPPALCVLAAAHINRKQLTDAQMTAIRYGCSIMVYVSSTADVFLNGVAQAPWLPLVLAAISLAGIFAGILWRIRAFLFMGIAFLLLAILTVIWHAAVDLDQTWLWWASGIVVGVLIIAVFAIFEKKRDEVLQVIDQLKHWHS